MEGTGAGSQAEEVTCGKALREHIELRTGRCHVAGDGEQMGRGRTHGLAGCCGTSAWVPGKPRTEVEQAGLHFKITLTAMVEA